MPLSFPDMDTFDVERRSSAAVPPVYSAHILYTKIAGTS
jgi:hypothetical protein